MIRVVKKGLVFPGGTARFGGTESTVGDLIYNAGRYYFVRMVDGKPQREDVRQDWARSMDEEGVTPTNLQLGLNPDHKPDRRKG